MRSEIHRVFEQLLVEPDPASAQIPDRPWPSDCADNDRDGWPACGSTVEVDLDCDDADPYVYPGKREMCNGIDDNCDGAIDEHITNCEE